MNTQIYATVGDEVKWFPSAKGGEAHRGEKGDWRNVEGGIVASGIDANSPEEFATKSTAIKTLWPTAVVRFMKTPKPV